MRSIRARLAIGLVAGLAVVLGAGGTALYYRMKAGLERDDDEALVSKAWAIASAVWADEGWIQFAPPSAVAADFERTDRLAGYEIRRRDGSLFARSRTLEQHPLQNRGSVGNEAEYSWTTMRENEPAREVAFRVPILSEDLNHPDADGEPAHESAVAREALAQAQSAAVREGSSGDSTIHGLTAPRKVLDEFTIRVVEEVSETRATLAELRTTILIVITLAFLMSIVLVQFVLRRALAPLDAIVAQAQTIDAESLDQRFSKDPLPSELEPIRSRLNALLDRLQQSFERERRFNAAVAHELRTPIAELRTLSEIALRWPERADAKKNMTDVLNVAQEMQSVVDALLTLRRVEAGAEKIELETVRMDEVVRAAIAAHGTAAIARDQTLRVNLPAGIAIESHPHMLRSIVSNLVSNAIEYAPKGSTIAVEARFENDRFHLSTRNPAPDLTPDDVMHLFEPFWRKDSVRTTGGSHAGLGLTLTESLAKALGCTLNARLEPDGELRIEIAGARLSGVPDGPARETARRIGTENERVEVGRTAS